MPSCTLIVKKKIDLNIWEKEKPCLTFIECERGSEENFLAQSRHWLYKKSFLITYSYENKTMVATCNSFKPGKSLSRTQQLKRGKHDMSTDERFLRTATETTRCLWKGEKYRNKIYSSIYLPTRPLCIPNFAIFQWTRSIAQFINSRGQ